MDAFRVYYDKGSIGLMITLARMPVEELRAICRENCLDCTGNYRKQQDSWELAEFITHRVRCMSEKGNAFR